MKERNKACSEKVVEC